MKKPKIGVPSGYKGCIIVPVNDGFDLFDRISSRWIHVKDQRSAKWNASVWTRLRDDFSASDPRKTPRVLEEIT